MKALSDHSLLAANQGCGSTFKVDSLFQSTPLTSYFELVDSYYIAQLCTISFQKLKCLMLTGTIHLIGGCVALTLAILSKPRPGRFPDQGLKNTKWSRKNSTFGLSSITDLHKFQTNIKSGSNIALSGTGIVLSLIGSLSYGLFHLEVFHLFIH